MLGSHNSLTSYPCLWYLRPFNVFSKCQSKTIEEQLDAGVRFFDIRIKMKPDGSYCFAHGLAKYKCNSLMHILDVLEGYANLKDTEVYFRVMLEYNRKPKHYDVIKEALKNLITTVMSDRVSPYFCGAYAKWDYEEIMSGNIYLPITHKYSSCIGWKRFIHCIPYLYAKKHNKEFKEKYKDILSDGKQVLLLDFV